VDEDVFAVIGFFGTVITVLLTVVGPLVRAYARKVSGESTQRAASVPAEVAVRLERMEQTIDAMAIEMERISEGQRFVTKLLAERQPERVPLPGARDARQS